MKRKNLEKIIVLGLLLSSSMYGTAWAADNYQIIDSNTLIINEAIGQVNGDELHRSDKFKYGDKYFSDYENVTINASNQKGIKSDSLRLNAPKMNLTINVTGDQDNMDGISLYSWESNLVLNSYTANINSPISDALNTDFRATTINVQINNLKADVYQGHGIRANAHAGGFSNQINTITINDSSEINIFADASIIDVRNPTAVYAGDCANYGIGEIFGFEYEYGNKSTGKGVINLNGSNNITLFGKGNYGIWAGKNGEINANNVEIIAGGNNSYGIAATNGNITFDVDDSENIHGSMVVLNGNNNKITMNGDNSYAIYAQGKYINDNSNTVRSGEDGIGGLNVKGNILAEDNGAIDLTINNDQFLDEDNKINTNNVTVEGDILAKSAGNVNMAVKNMANIKGNIEAVGVNSAINIGSISAADGQSIMRANDSGSTSINITGNVQAANGATIDLSLGDGATFTGRVDDYKDADNALWDDSNHGSLFDKDFVNNNGVDGSGSVNLTLGNGSEWDVTAQSWVTKIDAENSIIDLTKGGSGNHAVHIGDLNGNATFVVNLDPDTEADVNNGNMIYVYNGEDAKNLNLRINNETEVLTSLADGEKLRFATVAEKGGGFGDTYVARGRGVINSGFSIKYEKYETSNDDENDKYNGGADFDASKPGSNYVNSIYENGENVYLVRDTSKDAGKSDSGATIINMSRANYKNAIYMDRLNKRMGEMRYVDGEEEQGLWVRLRHDRIGQSGDFRSMNTMYELGYDVKQPASSGEHRIGMAIDYMDGSTTYDDILGKGETKRYGLWLYDTWLGEKGHYTDYIVKWGHLSNEFDIRDKDSFEHIVGDYSNNVFSVSAEYGKKNDMGNNWYFEPQAQLQLARVTGADYVTTQGSKVSVDGINSLIGRAGFRIGRDMNENSTVYLKADLLHEFMGDQTVTAADATGTLREEFDNKGTWYDVGFGFAAKMSKNSYAFLDFERSFGNDNDETYQINAGLQWSF